MIQANWTYIVIAICILLAAFLVWNEVKRANKNYLLLRIASVLIATAMLACIALPIGYQTEVNQADQHHKFILLTQGFDADSLTADKGSRIFILEPSIKQAYPKATLLSDIDELADTVKNAQLHIYGYGLAANDLQQMNKANLVFHPVAAPAGISSISWNAELKAGEVLHIQGSYNNSSAQKVKLILKGLDTFLDTVTVKPNAQASFHLSTLPKVTGKVVYILQTVLNGDTLTQGNVPVEISPVKPLSILMLTASPDFESRFLKNWLGQNGYAVALRSAISKDKFNTEFINMQQLNLGRLSAFTLNKFDVVMGDLSVLNNLRAEGAALKQEVSDNGLGVIVRADSAGKASWLQKSFPVDKPAGKELASSALNINGEKSAAKQLGIPADHIVFQNGTQPLVTDAQNRILASSTLSGSGKLVFTTFNNTFSWMLGGNKQDYTALWSALINSAARKKITTQSDIATADIPFVNKPIVLQISQANASPLIINGEHVAPVQNAAIPFEWNVSYWPKGAGWQLVNNTNWWYVYNVDEWKGVQAAAKFAATNKYAKANSNADIVTKQIQQKVRIEIPKIYFYILLLVACTFLWIENKFS